MANTPFKLKSGNTTSFKTMGSSTPAASPVKQDWEAMHTKAKEKYSRYDNLTLEEYTTEAKRQQKHYNETGKWDASGVYDHSGKKKTTTTTATDDKTPKVVKEKNVDKDKSKTVHRKDGTIKKEVTKSVDEDSEGRRVVKDKNIYRKDGQLKKEVYKVKDTGYKEDEKYKIKTKYDKEGNIKRSKLVKKTPEYRVVSKRNKKGDII